MVCPNVKHWLVIAKRPWRRCFSILRTIVIGKTLTWWTLEVLRLMLDQFCEGHEVNSWRPGTISKVALKANEGRWSDSVIFSFFFRTGSSWDGCLLKGSQDIAWYFQEWFGAWCFWELVLLFSRGVNFQYVWREFWECDGCASSQLVRSNILQALFATPLFKAFA